MSLSRRSSADGPTPGSSADDVPDADPLDVARSICLSQLAMGPRTRGQLATVLRRRGIEDDVAAQVLDRFEEVALVDDAAFSENYVQRRHASSGLARRALGHELRGKGVSEAVVSEALETLDPDDELATARALVAKKLPSTKRLDVESRTRRLVGMLARWSRNMPRTAETWPRLGAYLARVKQRPGLRETHAREGLTDWIN